MKISIGLIICLFLSTYSVVGQQLNWAKQIRTNWTVSESYVDVDEFGNIYMVGSFVDSLDLNTSSTNSFYIHSGHQYGAFVAKYDSSGTLIWAKKIDGSNSSTYANNVKIDRFGDILISGQFYDSIRVGLGVNQSIMNLSSNGRNDPYLIKIDTSGNTIWAKSWGGSGNDFADDFTVDSIGNIYIVSVFHDSISLTTGSQNILTTNSLFKEDLFIMKLTRQGNFVWAKQFESSIDSHYGEIDISSNGDIYVGGYYRDSIRIANQSISTSLSTLNLGSVFVAKFDSNGNLNWLKGFENDTGKINLGDILVTNSDEIIVSGDFYGRGSFNFDPNLNEPPIYISSFPFISNPREAYFVKLDSTGSFISIDLVRSGSLPAIIYPYKIVQDNQDNLYVTGQFEGKVDFNPDTTMLYELTSDFKDAFTLKLDSNMDFVWATQLKGAWLNRCMSIDIDRNYNVISTGIFDDSIDVDPGINAQYLHCSSPFIENYLISISQKNNIISDIKQVLSPKKSNKIHLYPNPT